MPLLTSFQDFLLHLERKANISSGLLCAPLSPSFPCPLPEPLAALAFLHGSCLSLRKHHRLWHFLILGSASC